MNLHRAFPPTALRGLFPEYCHDCRRVQIILMNQELVGPLRLNVPGRERVRRKVSEVEGNNGLSSAHHGDSENIAVFGWFAIAGAIALCPSTQASSK
jgi:hypothetical protein